MSRQHFIKSILDGLRYDRWSVEETIDHLRWAGMPEAQICAAILEAMRIPA